MCSVIKSKKWSLYFWKCKLSQECSYEIVRIRIEIFKQKQLKSCCTRAFMD